MVLQTQDCLSARNKILYTAVPHIHYHKTLSHVLNKLSWCFYLILKVFNYSLHSALSFISLRCSDGTFKWLSLHCLSAGILWHLCSSARKYSLMSEPILGSHCRGLSRMCRGQHHWWQKDGWWYVQLWRGRRRRGASSSTPTSRSSASSLTSVSHRREVWKKVICARFCSICTKIELTQISMSPAQGWHSNSWNIRC